MIVDEVAAGPHQNDLGPASRGAFSSHMQARRLDRNGSEREAVGNPESTGLGETDFGGAIRAPLFLGVGPYPESEARAWVRARAAELRRRRAG